MIIIITTMITWVELKIVVLLIASTIQISSCFEVSAKRKNRYYEISKATEIPAKDWKTHCQASHANPHFQNRCEAFNKNRLQWLSSYITGSMHFLSKNDINAELAATFLEQTIRGRSLQKMMLKGKEERIELIKEMRSTHALLKSEQDILDAQKLKTINLQNQKIKYDEKVCCFSHSWIHPSELINVQQMARVIYNWFPIVCWLEQWILLSVLLYGLGSGGLKI